MAKVRYLKNAWIKKDAEDDYWLCIQSTEGLSAMFCLSETMDLEADENSIVRRALESWAAEQDSENGNS